MTLHTFIYKKPDCRVVHFFSKEPFPSSISVIHPGIERPTKDGAWSAPILRRNYLTGEAISLSASRQNRPHLPEESHCPLCAAASDSSERRQASSELPTLAGDNSDLYQWATFENLFPALAPQSGSGRCEVVIYTKEHNTHFGNLEINQIEGLIEVWQHRSKELGQDPLIQSVFIFENRGAEIGVTLHHPHGQIYAFSEPPSRLALELSHAETYYSQNMNCLVCDAAKSAIEQKQLVLHEGEHFVIFMPEAPRFPYELHITSKAHRTHIESLKSEECRELAFLLQRTVRAYDSLFGFPLPYILQHHQALSHATECCYYHWNIQITPFHRSADKLKYLAGAETGMGFFVNDSLPEQKIEELRQAFAKVTPQAVKP